MQEGCKVQECMVQEGCTVYSAAVWGTADELQPPTPLLSPCSLSVLIATWPRRWATWSWDQGGSSSTAPMVP